MGTGKSTIWLTQTLCSRRPEDPEELQKWVRKDKTARMTIGLTASDEMLENVSHTTTALDMWLEICNDTNAILN